MAVTDGFVGNVMLKTAEAVGKLVLRQGAELVGYSFVVELSFLHGARRLGTEKVDTLVTF